MWWRDPILRNDQKVLQLYANIDWWLRSCEYICYYNHNFNSQCNKFLEVSQILLSLMTLSFWTKYCDANLLSSKNRSEINDCKSNPLFDQSFRNSEMAPAWRHQFLFMTSNSYLPMIIFWTFSDDPFNDSITNRDFQHESHVVRARFFESLRSALLPKSGGTLSDSQSR
jgi:hypothetical protein